MTLRKKADTSLSDNKSIHTSEQYHESTNGYVFWLGIREISIEFYSSQNTFLVNEFKRVNM